MANEEHLDILQQGAEAWNRWREANPSIRPDLFGTDLYGVDLRGADLSRADLGEANLRGAKLNKADLHGADLSWADLSKAKLSRAVLSEADLSRAVLSEADLSWADLSGADLNRADLSRADLSEAVLNRADLSRAVLSEATLSMANLTWTDFGGANLCETRVGQTSFGNLDLSTVKGLDTVRHNGPSTIGIDTIYRSGGNIPEVFLRGCGVQDDMIAYIRSIAGAIQFYSCFISYSTKDQDLATRLHESLQAKGVRCWFAPEDMKIGDKIWDRIDQSIRLYDKLLLILSEDAIASDWVEDEVTTAFEVERKRKQTVLFPVRLDDIVMETNEPWATKVRQRHIGDFCQWKDHDSYQTAFDRLLRDLKAESG